MPISLLQHLLLISLISTIICLTNFGHAYNLCQDDQKTFLLELKKDLKFDSSVSRKLVQWNQTDDCCKWKGVGCDAAGHVVILQLDYEGISGGIETSSSLVSLEFLHKLNLAHNSLNGTIPTLNLSNLVELDLSSNQLKGPTISHSFLNLESLEVLSLNNNSFNGTFQLESIQTLHNLTTLNLSHNNLSLDSNWSTFSQLKKLSLSSCNLHRFPHFLEHSNLNFFDLSDNQMTGEIPSWIWEIGNGDLYHLNLSYNALIDLQKPYHSPSSLAELDLHSNQLRGELPLLPRSASYVDFSDNKFDSPIPLDFVSFNFFLIFLSIANNSISGSIPTCICGAESIQVLDLSLNNLMSGSIPPCLVERMSNLQMLNLRRNSLSGDIPDKFSSICGMRILDLSNNNLGGNFPKSLENCKSLWSVNVGENNIEGSFPCMLSTRMKVLVLRSNRFQGEVKCGWPNLQIIDISSNNFSGDLHHISFSTWKIMKPDSDAYMKRGKFLSINVVRPDFSYLAQVTITAKGVQVNLVHIWPEYTVLDFSCNNLYGEIPEAIGDLQSLYLLNLSHNALIGRIPKSLGNMQTLEALDLSVNQLTETIPVELAQLTFLSVFNVSYNKLVGEVPNSRQFQTFYADSFKGNAGLCGKPVSISCSEDASTNMQPNGKSKMEQYHILFFIILALIYFV